MRAYTALVLGVVIAAAPRIAYSNPDSGSELTSSESDYESRNTYYASERPPCLDPNDVNGYRRCPRYGMWGDNLLGPNFFIEIGMNFRQFSSAGATTSSLARSTTTPVAPAGSDDARTYVERFGVGVTHFYTAAEFEFGSFGAMHAGSRDLVLDGLVSVGARARLGLITVAGEIDGGGMTYTYAYQSDQHSEWLADARARASIWITPWFTAGAMIGTSLIHSEHVAGLYIGLHTYAFGGSQ